MYFRLVLFRSANCSVIELYFCVVRTFDKTDRGVFEGRDGFSCLISVDCGVVLAIRVHRCDNFDVCADRILIYPDENERIMSDGSGRWDQRVAVEGVWCHKQLQVQT